MFLIAGLGNPDKQYEKTRHNVGFDAIDAIAQKFHISVKDKKFKGLCGGGMICGQKVLLLKPQTYMNLSGESIVKAMQFYQLNPATELLVIFDDISLAPGSIRIRLKGSAGGHKGIKSIIEQIGTQDFQRIKIGVGDKPEGYDLAGYVLGRFSTEERKLVESAIGNAVLAMESIIQGRPQQAMNDYNAKKQVAGET